MTRWLSKSIARLFVKLFAVAFAQLEASLDLVLMETQEELLNEAERSERRAGAVVSPAAMQLRAAAHQLSLLPAANAEEPQRPEPAMQVAKSRSKPKVVPADNEKRGRGRPRKVEETASDAQSHEGVTASEQ